MPMFSVPQFIDVEDKIAGPLTWRQLGWMLSMGGAVFIVKSSLPGTWGYVASVPVVLLFMALAFYRPNGQPFVYFLFHGLTFLFRPKVSVWERPPTVLPQRIKRALVDPDAGRSKVLSSDEIRELAQMVDRKG